jgi:hypothetical protein
MPTNSSRRPRAARRLAKESAAQRIIATPPKTPQYCRDRADQCERLVEAAPIPETRDVLLRIALRWRALAEQGEATLAAPG